MVDPSWVFDSLEKGALIDYSTPRKGYLLGGSKPARTDLLSGHRVHVAGDREFW